MIIPKHTIDHFKKIIESNGTFLVITHANPDGDAIGAALAWHTLLLNMNKQSRVVIPNDCPDFLKWMSNASDMIVGAGDVLLVQKSFEWADVLICVDFNNTDRAENIKPFIESFTKPLLIVDHHPDPQDFATYIISVPDASSTSEISYWTFCDLGYRNLLTKQIAEALYTGIITDTGGLSHNSSNPATYHAVADLLTCGIDKAEIHDNIFNNYHEGRMRLLGDVLSRNLRVLYEHNTAYFFITEHQQKYFGFKPGDSEGFVNIPLSIKGIRFCALFTETPDIIKISFRSKGAFPANKFAAQFFNGGGHLNAAGGRIKGKLFDAMHLFEDGIKAYKEELTK